MINTYNESSLHNNLKNMYAQKYQGTTEEKVDSFICDVVTNDGQIYEIQTANLSKLEQKIDKLIKTYKIQIIFPINETKIIETRDKNGAILSKRKSPKKEKATKIFREITKLYKFIEEPNFSIELLFIDLKEIRIKTDKAIQLKNKSRRFKKDWYKKDKELLCINKKILLKTKSNYLSLIKDKITSPECFCIKDLSIGEKPTTDERLIIWVLKKLNYIEETSSKGKTKFYKII